MITRTPYAVMLAEQRQNLKTTVAQFREMQRTGAAPSELVLALCFHEGQIIVDQSRFMPYLIAMVVNGSNYLMSQGGQDFKVVNKPILVADVLELCDHMIAAADLIPNQSNAMLFLQELGLARRQ